MNFILDSSLVLHLPLYELDGASFASSDSHRYPCTVTGAIWKPDGRYFDGTDDKITVPHQSTLDITEGITLEVWVRPDRVTGEQDIFVRDWGDSTYPYQLIISGSSYIFRDYSSGSWHSCSSGSGVAVAGRWQHVVGTYNKVNMRLFVDLREATPAAYTSSLAVNNTPLYIGSLNGSNPTEGLVGEARLYNRPLNPQEIQHNYLATKWRYK
jgi:hypothetical protein